MITICEKCAEKNQIRISIKNIGFDTCLFCKETKVLHLGTTSIYSDQPKSSSLVRY